MKKKYKLKKSAKIIIAIFLILIVALIILIISLCKNKSYSIEYNIDQYAISENFDSTEKVYYYEITYNKIDYNFIIEHDYIKNKKLIKNILLYEENNYTCLVLESEYINYNPLCSINDSLIDVHLVPNTLKEQLSDHIKTSPIEEKTYQNYTLYNENSKILIWSYKGFNYINQNEIKFIELFNKDIYDIPLATRINNYLFIPNYEQEYNFNEAYLINLDNYNVEKWQLDNEIAFDSYILGTNDKSIYLVDNKNKIEYELVPHKQKMRILARSNKQGIIFNNGIEQKIAISKLTSSTQSFTYKNNYQFTLEDNTLYMSFLEDKKRTLLSNLDVTSIIYNKKDEIYYLVNDTLYKYDLTYGENKLIKYSEWEFNNKNTIFIYDE